MATEAEYAARYAAEQEAKYAARYAAEQAARGPAGPPRRNMVLEAGGSFVEPLLKMATGAIAKPAGDVAGLLKGGYDWARRGIGLGQQGANAEEAQRAVQDALTYKPATMSGASEQNPINAVANTVGEAIGSIQPDAVTGEESSTFGGMTQNALRESIPQFLGFLGAAKGPAAARAVANAPEAVGQAAKRGAENVMVHAINPSLKQEMRGDAQFAARELLNRGLSPNSKGVRAVAGGIDDMNARAAAEIAASGTVIPKQAVLGALAPVSERFMYRPNLAENQRSIAGVGQEILDHPRFPGEWLPVPAAQELKIGYQAAARPAYGQEATAAQEAYKGVARGLRQEIETAHPNVAPWNAEASTLHRVLDVIDRSAAQNAKGPLLPNVGTIGGIPYHAAMAINRSPWVKSGIAHGLDAVGNFLTRRPEAPPAGPSPLAPVPFTRESVPGRSLELAPDPEGLDYASFARDYRAQKAMEAAGPDTLIAREQAANTARQTAAERVAEAAAQAGRQPASGGMPYDLDPITGRLRAADAGVRGATPDTVMNTGNSLAGAAEKISSGRSFAMSAEELAAWNATKVDLAKAVPEMRRLSNDAIFGKMVDRAWADKRIRELKTEYADWAAEAGKRFREKQTAELDARANSKAILTDAEKKARKAANSEAARRMQTQHEVRRRELQAGIDALERMTDLLSTPRAGTGPQGGPGRKTREHMANALLESRK